MPGVGTHTTIIEYLAKKYAESPFGAALGDPDKNAKWTDYESDAGLQARYAVLGAMGPDIFYAMLDYGRGVQDFEDVAIKIAGTFQCVGEISQEINNYVNGTLDKLTDGAWKSIKDMVKTLNGIMLEGILATVIKNANFWTVFLPLRQVDDYPHNWYWADYLHYVSTGRFVRKLLDNCRQYYEVPATRDSRTTRFLTAYTLGYLTHYVADTIGHAYVNRIVQAPWRNCWQRHHLVENFIDAFLWEQWHDGQPEPDEPSTEEQPLDIILTAPGGKTMPAPYRYSRLNDLCNIGSAGIDPIIDGAIAGICQKIQNGLFDFGLTQVRDLQAPDDPAFTTWTEFLADAIVQTYPPGTEHPTKLASSPPKAGADGYPTPADIAAAYGAYRLVLSFATEDDVKRPDPPDVLGDLGSLISDAWNSVVKDLGSIPPPPPLPSSSGFSLSALVAAVEAYARWAGQVAEAVLKAAGDLIEAGFQLGVFPMTESAKVLLYLLNSALYSVYSQIRLLLVMQAYSAPATEDLTATWGPLDLRQLWTIAGEGPEHYPFEPVVSQRDLVPDPTHPHTPYYPYFPPSTLQPAHIEFPPTTVHEAMRRWGTPDDMLTAPIGPDRMFSAAGPAPPVLVPMTNPDGSTLADAESFDGSQRYFGGIFDNCAAALEVAFGYLTSGTLPADWEIPDYNLDSDRGFAWPCWDVDYAAPGTGPPFPWNGCDPFPSDTLMRVADGSLNWGDTKPNQAQVPPGLRPGLSVNDPWGKPRDGMAWVNATAIPAPSGYFDFAFPSIAVDPSQGDVDPCRRQAAVTEGSPPGADYHVCETGFLLNSHAPGDPDFVGAENDGRLIDYLRLFVAPPNPDPVTVLATATALAAGRADPEVLGGPPLPFPLPPDPTPLVTAVAQLAVTGRRIFDAFAGSPPQDQEIADTVTSAFPGLDPAVVLQHAHDVLDIAYTALWSIRSNDPGWRAYRFGRDWIAVSGCDDTPHRPVNVPTAPYPQFDLPFTIPQLGTEDPCGTDPQVPVTTRYMIAQAHGWVGPTDQSVTSFSNPDPNLLLAPSGPFSATPAPRSVPDDAPAISPTSKIIIYVHGGGSRAEEAVGMASYLISEGAAIGEEYTVISFDLPNSAYASPFDVSVIASSQYHPSRLHVLHFEEQFIINFIEALDVHLGNVKGRIVAVMGGSLGGNMSLLLTGHTQDMCQQTTIERPYLNTMVAWSATATASATYLGLLPQGILAAYVGGLRRQVMDQEIFTDHTTESGYLHDMYFKPLVPGVSGITPVVPPQPLMWYRAGQPDNKGKPDWLLCKQAYIAQSRFDRYEIYSMYSRHWAVAIDLEQIWFSFQDNSAPEAISWSPGSRLLLLAGDWDNYNPNQIFNSTIDVTRMIRRPVTGPPPRGKAEFWADTGHSFHDERPHLFASEIVYFLTHPDAGDSPHGTVVSTPQRAPYTEISQ